MNRFAWGVVALALLLLPKSVAAGPDAEVASAADPADPFDLHVFLDYEYSLRRSAIERERVGEGGGSSGEIPVGRDLVYSSTRHTLTPRAEVGLYHDLALTFALPIVILDTRQLELDQRDTPCTFDTTPSSPCVDRDNSTTIRDGLLSMQGFDARDPSTSFPGSEPMIFRGIDRRGLDQLHVGVTWAPMNQLRDDTKPTWKLHAELRIPVGKVEKFDAADPASANGVSSGVEELRLGTTVDKKVGWAEPFFEAWWQAPISAKKGSLFQDPGFGSKAVTMQQQAGTRFGFEAIAVDRGPDAQRVGIELSANLIGHFQGRGYSEMWEVFALAGDSTRGGPLILDADPTATGVQAMSHPGISNIENYLEGGGRAALNIDLGPLVHISALGELTRESTHLISFADAGRDRPTCGAGEAPGEGCEIESNEVVNPGTSEVNPLHVPVIDLVGHRYVSQGAANLRVGVQVRVLF